MMWMRQRYDEDRVLPSDLYTPDPRPSSELLQLARQKQSTIRGLLQKGDVAGALGTGLDDAPFGEGEHELEEAKVRLPQSFSLALILIRGESTIEHSISICSLCTQLDKVNRHSLPHLVTLAG